MKTLNHSKHITCVSCRKKFRVMVNIEDFTAWQEGESIQRALPYLNADERELLMTHICGKCFDEAFGGYDE